MIGLEYVLKLWDMQQDELAERLGIKKQNINYWVTSKRNIPKKYLPNLTDIFNIPSEYFQKELEDLDKEKIQMMKLYSTNNEEELGYKKIDKIIDTGKWDLGDSESEFEKEMKISLLEYNTQKEELLNEIYDMLDLGIGKGNYTPSAYIFKISSREIYLEQIKQFVEVIKKSSDIERQIIRDIVIIFENYLIFGYKKEEYKEKENKTMNIIMKNQVDFSNKLMDIIINYKNVLLEQNIQLGKEIENNILQGKNINDLLK
nr:helix-turn-helix domain-containing protein [Clostridium neonatale]DAW05997.1 MAG TPA: helix-turn-helix domain protein [Caudoviricetes sp.]